MVIRKAIVALASASLVFGSTAAVAAPSSVEGARSDSSITSAEAMRGGSWAWILALIILAGVVGVIATDSKEDLPVSP